MPRTNRRPRSRGNARPAFRVASRGSPSWSPRRAGNRARHRPAPLPVSCPRHSSRRPVHAGERRCCVALDRCQTVPRGQGQRGLELRLAELCLRVGSREERNPPREVRARQEQRRGQPLVRRDRLGERAVGVGETAQRVFEEPEVAGDRTEPVGRVVDELVAVWRQRRVELCAERAIRDRRCLFSEEGDGDQPVELVADLLPSRPRSPTMTATSSSRSDSRWISPSAAFRTGSPGDASTAMAIASTSSSRRPW